MLTLQHSLTNNYMFVVAEWAVPKASMSTQLLEEQKILSFKLFSLTAYKYSTSGDFKRHERTPTGNKHLSSSLCDQTVSLKVTGLKLKPPVFSHRHMLVLAQWAASKTSISIHILERQEILSFQLLSERFSESYCNHLRLLFIIFSCLGENIDQLPEIKSSKLHFLLYPVRRTGIQLVVNKHINSCQNSEVITCTRLF